jgi:transposase
MSPATAVATGPRVDSRQFCPAGADPELRDLTRTRKQLVAEIARHALRIQKTLEDANLKLTHVVSDILGASGQAILKALIAGETDPARLADLTTGRLQASRAQLIAALRGRVTPHHRFMIELPLHAEELRLQIAAFLTSRRPRGLDELGFQPRRGVTVRVE